MKRQYAIILFLLITVFIMAGTRGLPTPSPGADDDSVATGAKEAAADTAVTPRHAPDSMTLAVGNSLAADSLLNDSLRAAADSLSPENAILDSLRLAIEMHNKAIDDSIRRDSINKSRSRGIEAPVHYQSEDSMVYLASTKKAYLFGKANVKYQDMTLDAENVDMSNETSLVHATGVWADTTHTELTGRPHFEMGSDSYDNDTILFNFKTKKGLINNVTTQQQEGFLTSEIAKRDANGDIFLKHGRYTTCDKEEDPDFYIAISRAKLRTGKDVVFGPAHLVVADVPLPLALPYGFFPFTKKYSSGIIMPTYGDEQSRGFYLRDGGYYFALGDKMDMKIIGEIYTKGSWGVSLTTNYKKRYKFSGSFLFSFQDTRNSEKDLPDYSQQKSFKVQWSHRQDPKSNPYSSLSASVNFATSSYEKNNLNSAYNPQAMTQSTRTSSINWSTGFSSIGLNLSASANLSQNMRDSTLSITLPDLNITLSRFYPFKRKHTAGKERWYEKIALSYTGRISNSYQGKESQVLKANPLKDWRNGMNHSIPLSGSFTLFDYINITPSFNFTDRTYLRKEKRSWDEEAQREVVDTLSGFYNVYNWNAAVSMSTKLYGFYIPIRKIFGNKIDRIRHVLTPSVSFSFAPDFGASRYGYYDTYQKTDAEGNVSLVEYSPYQGQLYGVPGKGKTGSIAVSIDNNVELKWRNKEDSLVKVSIIDNFGLSMSYNLAAQKHPWSDLNTRLRLKLSKSYTFNFNADFATYAYELDEKGVPYIGDRTEWGCGRFGRFKGTSQNISFTLTPDKLKKWFGGKKDDEEEEGEMEKDYGMDTDVESNIDDVQIKAQKGLRKKKKKSKADTDDDGYMTFSMPWSLTVGYGIVMRENTAGKFNTKTMRYPYKFTQTLNCSGNIRLAEGWNISFSTGYDFENKKISMTTASLSRDLHCFSMSCSVVLAPYTSYNFSFRCNASTLTDVLKYDKRSGYSNAVKWY